MGALQLLTKMEEVQFYTSNRDTLKMPTEALIIPKMVSIRKCVDRKNQVCLTTKTIR